MTKFMNREFFVPMSNPFGKWGSMREKIKKVFKQKRLKMNNKVGIIRICSECGKLAYCWQEEVSKDMYRWLCSSHLKHDDVALSYEA